MFYEERFEINVSGSNTVTIFVWDVPKEEIWQAAVQFESSNIKVGYGFSETKKTAAKKAWDTLFKRIAREHILNLSLEASADRIFESSTDLYTPQPSVQR